MHISLVSTSTGHLSCSKIFQSINNISLFEMTDLNDIDDKNIKPELIFFDANIGLDIILKQVTLCHQLNTQPKWVVINLDDIHQSLRYLRTGASGLFSNLFDKETLLLCLQSITQNQLYLDSRLTQVFAFRQIEKILHPFSQLTAREFDVFCLLVENYPIKTIAIELAITEKTAFNCQTQLRKKLNLKTQSQLTLLAKKNGLIL
jgi:DNA-binding NarL/FixJ family response regulator